MKIKEWILTFDYKLIGVLTALVALLLMAVVSHFGQDILMEKENKITQAVMILVLLSPLIAMVLTGLRLRMDRSATHSFGSWTKKLFINFIIATLILVVAGLIITKQPHAFRQFLYYQFYLFILIPVIGLFASLFTTVVMKR